MKYIYGPIPSRRLGRSLGISPIPSKLCNYSCIYCQLGKRKYLTNKRKIYIDVNEIIYEFKTLKNVDYDVVTICGEGEPTLSLHLGKLIVELKKITNKPICVITNGSLLNDKNVRNDLSQADIVLPSLDGYDEKTFRKINRSLKEIKFIDVYEGLKLFTKTYHGKVWLEIMIIAGINDNDYAIEQYLKLLKAIKIDRLYLNSPVRPPAEDYVRGASEKFLNHAARVLNAMPIINHSSYFQSEEQNDFKAIINIIERHPMNKFEIIEFLKLRNCINIEKIFKQLFENDNIERIDYKGIIFFRIKR